MWNFEIAYLVFFWLRGLIKYKFCFVMEFELGLCFFFFFIVGFVEIIIENIK